MPSHVAVLFCTAVGLATLSLQGRALSLASHHKQASIAQKLRLRALTHVESKKAFVETAQLEGKHHSKGYLAETLMRKVCPKCGREATSEDLPAANNPDFVCPNCGNTGAYEDPDKKAAEQQQAEQQAERVSTAADEDETPPSRQSQDDEQSDDTPKNGLKDVLTGKCLFCHRQYNGGRHDTGYICPTHGCPGRLHDIRSGTGANRYGPGKTTMIRHNQDTTGSKRHEHAGASFGQTFDPIPESSADPFKEPTFTLPPGRFQCLPYKCLVCGFPSMMGGLLGCSRRLSLLPSSV